MVVKIVLTNVITTQLYVGSVRRLMIIGLLWAHFMSGGNYEWMLWLFVLEWINRNSSSSLYKTEQEFS